MAVPPIIIIVILYRGVYIIIMLIVVVGTLKREHNGHNGLVDCGSPKLNGSPKLHNPRAIKLLSELQLLLDDTDDRWRVYRQLKPETQRFFQHWMAECGNDKVSESAVEAFGRI